MNRHAFTTTITKASLATISLAILGVATVSAATTPAPAQTSNPASAGQALEIAPPVLNVTANPGETLTLQISLRDVSPGKLLVTGEANDFVAAGEDGIPKIILEEGEPNPYSLKPWIGPLPTLTLEPRKVQNFPVTVKVPTNAAPGGYYGVIRFTAKAPEQKENGVALSASLGALILLRVNGEVNEKLSVEEFAAVQNDKVASVFQSTPIKFIERIKNEGSIHEQPAGQITITDMFGKKVAIVNVNLPPRNILPASIRKFEQTLDKSTLGEKQLFGRYKATLAMTYGTNKQVTTSEIIFWVIPYTLIGIIIAGLIIGFFVLRFLIRRYNDHVLSRGSRYRRR
jgi:hypothetical protein